MSAWIAGHDLGSYSIQQGAKRRQNHLLVRACDNITNSFDPLNWQQIRGHVHALARQCQQQPQYFRPIALEFFGGSDRGIASYTTLPYRIGNFVFGILWSWQREIGEEQHIDQGIDQLLCQRLYLLELFTCGLQLRQLFL